MSKPEECSISFKLKGTPEDLGKVRLQEFMIFLQNASGCLSKIDRSITKKEKPSSYYRIADLVFSSAMLTLEAVPYNIDEDNSPIIVRRMKTGLEVIQEQKKIPEWLDRPLLESFRELTNVLKRHVTEVEIMCLNKRINITNQFEANIDKILGKDIVSEGSVTGQLDAVNVHARYEFHIYPVIGPTKILCRFPTELIQTVKAGIRKQVNVTGKLRYKEKDIFPYQVDVKEIEIYPDKEELPTLSSLRGMVPRMPGQDAVSFVRRLRDEEN